MLTVKETDYFQRIAAGVWQDGERIEFIDWIAVNPLAGDVIPGTASLRKVRWQRAGMGKRSGARVIYFNRLEAALIVLLTVHTKNKFDNLRPEFLNYLKEQGHD
jgi:hypothetical protein